MLVAKILEETGLPFTEVAFNNPPGETYAVYTQEITRRGADTLNCISEHDVSVEVYSYDFYDGEAVRAVAGALDRNVFGYTQYDTSFINSEKLYCTRFEFSFITKDLPSRKGRGEEGFDFCEF